MQASGKELVLVSRLTVFVWSVWMGGLLAILNAANVNVYWLGIWTGVVSSGVALVSCLSIDDSSLGYMSEFTSMTASKTLLSPNVRNKQTHVWMGTPLRTHSILQSLLIYVMQDLAGFMTSL